MRYLKKISVIIPTYNPGNYICELFTSLASQTLEPELFEVLIIVNGESSSLGIVKSYAIEYLRELEFTVLYSDTKGVSAARNLGLEYARGEHIAFVDDDDFLSNNYLQSLLEQTIPNGIVISNSKEFRDDIHNSYDTFLTSAYNILVNNSAITYSNRSLFSNVWGKLIPRSLIGNNRFNTKISIGEDCCFMTSLLPVTKYLSKSDSNCVYYCRNRYESSSKAHRHFKEKIINKSYQLFDYLHNFTPIAIDHKTLIFINRIGSVLLSWK